MALRLQTLFSGWVWVVMHVKRIPSVAVALAILCGHRRHIDVGNV
jgi:hypothetical protein